MFSCSKVVGGHQNLRVVCVMGKRVHAQGFLEGTVAHNHFSTLNFCYQKVLQLHSPLKSKAPV